MISSLVVSVFIDLLPLGIQLNFIYKKFSFIPKVAVRRHRISYGNQLTVMCCNVLTVLYTKTRRWPSKLFYVA